MTPRRSPRRRPPETPAPEPLGSDLATVVGDLVRVPTGPLRSWATRVGLQASSLHHLRPGAGSAALAMLEWVLSTARARVWVDTPIGSLQIRPAHPPGAHPAREMIRRFHWMAGHPMTAAAKQAMLQRSRRQTFQALRRDLPAGEATLPHLDRMVADLLRRQGIAKSNLGLVTGVTPDLARHLYANATGSHLAASCRALEACLGAVGGRIRVHQGAFTWTIAPRRSSRTGAKLLAAGWTTPPGLSVAGLKDPGTCLSLLAQRSPDAVAVACAIPRQGLPALRRLARAQPVLTPFLAGTPVARIAASAGVSVQAVYARTARFGVDARWMGRRQAIDRLRTRCR